LYPEGGYLSKNKLSRMEALTGMTQWGAYASFEENQKGTIEVGKVVVLNPLLRFVYCE